MPRDFASVGVVGLGTMGAGIAEVFAGHGLAVVGVERDDELLARGRTHVESSTSRAVARGKLTPAEQSRLVGGITFTTTLADVAGCDLVIEAVVERLDAKQQLFTALDQVVGADAVLATNTSSLSVTEIAAATAHPHRVVGLHFFNPAPVQGLCEVVRTVVAAPEVVDDVVSLCRRLDKHPVVAGDRAGFIANALLFGYLNHAMTLYDSRHASREDIDLAMRLGCDYPMGPLALLDLIGLDTALQVLETMYLQSHDRLHAPAPVLKQLVTAGLLGRKSGRGFYTYATPHTGQVAADSESPPGTAGHSAQRPVDSVVVVGGSPAAGGLAGVFARAGFEVTQAELGSGPGFDHASMQTLAAADLVVETGWSGGPPDQPADGSTGASDEAARLALLAQLDRTCRPGAVLATSASRGAVIAAAAATSRPADVVGMHVIGPSAQPVLVEVVSSIATSAEAADTVRAVCSRLGVPSVSCGDRAGYLVHALLVPYLNDAVRMLGTGYASAADIDTAMREGCRLPKGPFEMLGDLGADTVLALQRRLHQESGEPGLAPAPLLPQLVLAAPRDGSGGPGVGPYGV